MVVCLYCFFCYFFFQAEDGIRDLVRSRGLGDVYKRQNQTLVDIGATDKPTILVFNKIDAYHYIPKEEDDLTPATRENMSLEDLKKSWISNIQGTCIFISAVNRTNVEELRLKLTEMVKELHFVRYPNYLDNDSSSGE